MTTIDGHETSTVRFLSDRIRIDDRAFQFWDDCCGEAWHLP